LWKQEEQISTRTGDAVGGLLNATFGNAPELIIATVALKAGYFDMVRASIIGAIQNKMDLTVDIALGSSIQIALFVAPILVIASYFIAPQPLELSFGRSEIGSMFIVVLIGSIVSGHGHSNWYKGVQLTTVYVIIALMFYLISEIGP